MNIARLRSIRMVVLLVAIIASGMIAGGAYQFTRESKADESARPVRPVTNASASRDATLAEASLKAGFEIREPWLPDGFEVKTVSSTAPGSISGTYRSASLTIAGPEQQGFDIVQHNSPVESDGAKVMIPSGLRDAAIWRVTNSAGTVLYFMNTADRGFQVSLFNESLLPEDQVLKILESMAQ